MVLSGHQEKSVPNFQLPKHLLIYTTIINNKEKFQFILNLPKKISVSFNARDKITMIDLDNTL